MPNARSQALIARLTTTIVHAFHLHWRKILRLIRQHPQSLPRKFYTAFEADIPGRQRALARAFYNLRHAEEMAGLSEREVRLQLMDSYLPAALAYSLEELNDDVRAQVKLMQSLVREEYVIVDNVDYWANCGAEEKNWSGCTVSAYPSGSEYDDWYDRTGEDCLEQFMVVLYKSTGEEFSTDEIEWLPASVGQCIEGQSETRARWSCDVQIDNCAAYVFASEDDPGDYVADIKIEMRDLPRAQLLSLARGVDLILTERNLKRSRPRRAPIGRARKSRGRIPVYAPVVVSRGNQIRLLLPGPIHRARKSELIAGVLKAIGRKRFDWEEIQRMEEAMQGERPRWTRRGVG